MSAEQGFYALVAIDRAANGENSLYRILKPMTVTFYEGESVFNILQRTCKQQKIHMEFDNTPIYNSAYIS